MNLVSTADVSEAELSESESEQEWMENLKAIKVDNYKEWISSKIELGLLKAKYDSVGE